MAFWSAQGSNIVLSWMLPLTFSLASSIKTGSGGWCTPCGPTLYKRLRTLLRFVSGWWISLGTFTESTARRSLKWSCHFWKVGSQGRLPLSRRRTVLTFLPEKGDLQDIKNWRPVSLLSTDYKLLSKVLSTQLWHHAEAVGERVWPPIGRWSSIGLACWREIIEGPEPITGKPLLTWRGRNLNGSSRMGPSLWKCFYQLSTQTSVPSVHSVTTKRRCPTISLSVVLSLCCSCCLAGCFPCLVKLSHKLFWFWVSGTAERRTLSASCWTFL